MDDGVARAADGHAGLDGIGDGLFGNDLPGSDFLGIELHDLLTGGLGQLLHLLASTGGAGVAGHRHSDDLGNNGHGVAGTHHAAGPSARNGYVHQFIKVSLGNFPFPQAGLIGADVNEVHIFAPVIAGLHIAAGNNHRRQIQTAGSHQQGGQHLIAGPDHHQCVHPVIADHQVNVIDQQVTAGQGVLLVFQHTVAEVCSVEFHR